METRLTVTGMTCTHCVDAVRQALEAVPGVESAAVSLEDGQVRVIGDADDDALVAAVIEEGYEVSQA